MKIDVFPHIIPPKYKAALYKKLPEGFFGKGWIEAMPCPVSFFLFVALIISGVRNERLFILYSLPFIKELADLRPCVGISSFHYKHKMT